MQKLLSMIALGVCLSFGAAQAQDKAAAPVAAPAAMAAAGGTCATQAADKKLNGAAKKSFVTKCEKDSKAAAAPACATKDCRS